MPRVHWSHVSSRTGDLPTPPGSTQQTMCLVFDGDKDRHNDIVIACRNQGPAIVWYRHAMRGWMLNVIEKESIPVEAGGVIYDVDGDGNPDIIAGEDYQGGKVYWWKNPYPHFAPDEPWRRYEIKSGGAHQHHDQIVGDFDGDGRPELVFWNQGARKLFHAVFPPDPHVQPWPFQEIWSGDGEGVASGDIDGDGRVELLAGGKWFKHVRGQEFEAHVIDPAQTRPRMAVADLNGDGKLEVVMVPGDSIGRLKWYECKGDPRETASWVGHDLLDRDVIHGHTLGIGDVDRDGHPDIFCGEMGKWTESAPKPDNPDCKTWIFFGDGKGGFTPELVSTGIGIHEGKLADVDGDGRLDIVGKPYNWDTPRLDLWLNKK